MSPIRFQQTGDIVRIYESPFVGPIDHTVGIPVDLSGLTDDEIDAKGYVKPGIPLTREGALVGDGDDVFGVTVEEVKVAANNAGDTIAELGIQEIAVALIGTVNQKVAEDLIGRVYTAGEIAGFAASQIVLLTPAD